ncbi:unnamed protein product [Linum trigynum]|uniref:Uncharacterized protein n=1 Tax=Linum trigynum TaxID=586398 RepID=A0AAV2FM43_9ROSI
MMTALRRTSFGNFVDVISCRKTQALRAKLLQRGGTDVSPSVTSRADEKVDPCHLVQIPDWGSTRGTKEVDGGSPGKQAIPRPRNVRGDRGLKAEGPSVE